MGLFVVISLTVLAAIAVFLQYSEMQKEKFNFIELKISEQNEAVDEGAYEKKKETEENNQPEAALQVYIQNILTDKKVYHSSEIINLDLIISATGDLKDVVVRVTGIKNKLNKEKTVDITEGENDISFSYQLPKCNVCGGISEGEYPIDCEISYDEIVLNDSVTIEVQQ